MGDAEEDDDDEDKHQDEGDESDASVFVKSTSLASNANLCLTHANSNVHTLDEAFCPCIRFPPRSPQCGRAASIKCEYEEQVTNGNDEPQECVIATTTRAETSDQQFPSIQPDRPTCDLDTYEKRLDTFRRKHWSHECLAAEVLAEANFCYLGKEDEVHCVGCGESLRGWERGDDPRQEHLSNFGYYCV